MTFSIIAFDPGSHQSGIAAASRVLAVGSYVPYAQWNLGAVVSQGLVPNYGEQLLQEGLININQLPTLIKQDPFNQHRQIAALDRYGQSYHYDGSQLVPISGHIADRYVSVQGNMLTNFDTLEAMMATYHQFMTKSNYDFGECLLQALEAGEQVGGDKRLHSPHYSAALLIARECETNLSHQCLIDLRVDHSFNMQPIQELKLLYYYKKNEPGDIILTV